MNNSDERDYAEEDAVRADLEREAQAELEAGCLRCQYGSAVVFDHDADCQYRQIPLSELAYIDSGSSLGNEES